MPFFLSDKLSTAVLLQVDRRLFLITDGEDLDPFFVKYHVSQATWLPSGCVPGWAPGWAGRVEQQPFITPSLSLPSISKIKWSNIIKSTGRHKACWCVVFGGEPCENKHTHLQKGQETSHNISSVVADSSHIHWLNCFGALLCFFASLCRGVVRKKKKKVDM